MNTRQHPFSVVITVYDQAHDLEEQLPAFLKQEYEPGYEVIVVDESSTDETPDVLKLLKSEYKHLYSTFLPKPSAQTFRRKLALNIGIKASHNEYIIIAKANNAPADTDVFKAIAEVLDAKAELTLGYVTKKHIRLTYPPTGAQAEEGARTEIRQLHMGPLRFHHCQEGLYLRTVKTFRTADFRSQSLRHPVGYPVE